MLFCFRYKKLLMPYAEGALGMRLRARVEMHVSRCPSCAAELAELRYVSSALREADVPAVEPAPDLWMRVQQAIEEPVPLQRPWWHLKSYHAASAAAVAAVFLIAVLSVQLPVDNRYPKSTPHAKVPQSMEQDTDNTETHQPALSEPVSPTKSKVHRHFSKGRTVSSPASMPPYSEKTSSEAKARTNGDESIPSPISKKEAIAESKESVRLGNDLLAESNGPRDDADTVVLKRVTRSPFSQMGRAPGGSQNAEVIEKSQGSFGADSYTGKPVDNAASAYGMPFRSAPAPAEPVTVNKSAPLANDSIAAASPLEKEKPISPDSVTCNARPSFVGMSKSPTPSSAGDSRTSAGPTTCSEVQSVDGSIGLAEGVSSESKKATGGVVGRAKREIGDIEKHVKKHPKDAGAWLELAGAYEKAGLKDKAKDAYKKAIELGDKEIRITAEAKLKNLEEKEK